MYTGEPEPGVRRVVLQRDRLMEQAQRLGRLPEFDVRPAHIDESTGLARLDLHRALQGLERLMGALVAQKHSAQVGERIGVVRVSLEVELEMLDSAGNVAERRVRVADVEINLVLGGSE